MGQSNGISQWTAEGVGFQRVDVAQDTGFVFSKVLYDEVVMLAFTGALWKSEQAGQSYLETPGCVVLRDAGQVFSTRLHQLDLKTGSSCREIHVPPQRLRELYETSEGALPALEFKHPLLHSPRLAQQLFRVHQLFEREDCSLEASTGFAQLVANLAVASSGRALHVSRAACSRRSERVVQYLRENFADKITLPQLAQLTESNPYVLLRQFRRETGATPHDYLRAYRVYRAKQFIQRGLPLAEVALRCGFADQSHLNRQFKRCLSISPSMYQSISSKTAGTTPRRTRAGGARPGRTAD
jgi:AraC-like DNA-binding protein